MKSGILLLAYTGTSQPAINLSFDIHGIKTSYLTTKFGEEYKRNALLIAKPRDVWKTGKTGKFLGMRSMLLPNPF